PEKAVLGNDAIDLNNILAGRWLRFWVNPYADQIGRTQLEERINASEAKRKVTVSALAEEARLLYVGITRARDYLIFPTTNNPTRWLNRAWHGGNEDYPTLDEGNETHFEWAGKYLAKDFETFWFTKDFGYAPKPIETISFIENRSGKGDFLAYKIDFEKENLAITESKNSYSSSLDFHNYALPLLLKEDATPSVVKREFLAQFARLSSPI
ncbi:MAG: hypothetical protein HC817_15200, partial [Saprospiraceae bacterium]|nr:hypothetical protein [Saprospiraceae bacterium]